VSSEGSDPNADATPDDDRPRVVNTGDGYERVDDADANAPAGTDSTPDGDAPADTDADGDGLGRTGWVLVAVVVVAFLVVPGIIYVRPTVPGELGFRFLAAMLVLPFLPALLLGVTAVWSLVAGGE